MVPVIWLEAHPLCWDQGIVDRLLPTTHFEHSTGWPDVMPEGAVVVVPARYYAAEPGRLVDKLDALAWSVVLLTSDEEATFPWREVTGDRRRVWVQSPRPALHGDHDRFLPVGPPPGTHEAYRGLSEHRTLDWFFSGQVTHHRRQEAAAAMRLMPGGRLVETEGFTQGLPRDEYLAALATAKVIPCPSGPASLDTFRLWEALEAGCIPVADAQSPADVHGMWDLVAPGAPWPIIDNWSDLHQFTVDLTSRWTTEATKVGAWWLKHLRSLRRRLWHDIASLSGVSLLPSNVTVLIPTSPIPSHPDTSMIEETVASVRHHYPTADVLIMCDGVRRPQSSRRPAYEEYLRRLVILCQRQWEGVTPLIFDGCHHQAEMTKVALGHVDSPLIMFVEHDTPLVTDEPIPFECLEQAIITDQASVIRLHHEGVIVPEHEHMMLDAETVDVCGAPLRRTVQWSQRPHLAAAGFYRHLLDFYFSEGRRTMIEDVVHGVIHTEWRRFGLAGWDRFRLWMFTPAGGNYKRSYHLDGRGSDDKWVEG